MGYYQDSVGGVLGWGAVAQGPAGGQGMRGTDDEN